MKLIPDEWWKRLNEIAKQNDLLWILGDKETCLDFYNEDLSPEEALQELYEEAERNI